MSTYTTNYLLEKPDSTDDFGNFRTNYNNNMDIIDQNLGGGGSGGHTIIDPSGTSMPQEDDLQFTGKVSVTDDNANQKTVVNVLAQTKEVTQAEYDALPATKLTDGIAYFIKDAVTPDEIFTVISGELNIIFDDGN